MSKIHQPHDKLFKAAFGKKVVTKDFLLNRLPKDLLAKIDIDSLKRENASFVDEKLKAYYSDVVYKVKTNEGLGYLYFLLEEQTEPDRLIPLRLLQYNVAIMHYDVEGKVGEEKDPQAPIKLPVIYNFVVYTGKKKWRQPTRLIDAFETPSLLYRMFEDDFLVNLNTQTKEQIMEDGKAATAELILREGWRKEFCKFLEKNEWLHKRIYNSLYTKPIVLYIIDRDKHNVDRILEKLPNLDPKLKDDIMTGLQRIEQKGIEKGLEQGIQKGIQKGIQQGIQAIRDFLKEGLITKEQAEKKIQELKAQKK